MTVRLQYMYAELMRTEKRWGLLITEGRRGVL